MGVIQRVPWTVQPQVAVGIDSGNPLSKGLLRVIIPPNAGALSKTAAVSVERSPKGLVFLGAASPAVVYGSIPAIGSEATILLFSTMALVANVGVLGGIGNDSGGNHLFAFQNADLSGTTGARAVIRLSNGGGISSVESASLAGFLGSTLIEPWVVVYDGTSSLKLYRNGVDDSGTRLNVAASGAATGLNLACANGIQRGTPSGATAGQKQALCAVWNRALSPAEVAKVSANPWQLFAPLPRTIWVPVSAGGGSFQPAWAAGATKIIGSGIHA